LVEENTGVKGFVKTKEGRSLVMDERKRMAYNDGLEYEINDHEAN
jgi:hypothetical protein